MLIVLLGAGGIPQRDPFQFADMATNFVKLAGQDIPAQPYEGLQAGRRVKLDSTERPFLEEQFNQVCNVSPLIIRRGPNFYEETIMPGVLQGVLPRSQNVEAVEIRAGNGRFINEADIQQARKVIVLHSRTAGLLFKDKSLWEHISITTKSCIKWLGCTTIQTCPRIQTAVSL